MAYPRVREGKYKGLGGCDFLFDFSLIKRIRKEIKEIKKELLKGHISHISLGVDQNHKNMLTTWTKITKKI